MASALTGKKILILVGNGVDEGVMSVVQRELVKTGATVKTVGIEPGLVNSWNNNAWGLYFPVDQQMNTTLGSDFDCLIVPSGSRSIAKLGANAHSERIIASFIQSAKPMAFIGDAVELLAKVALATGWNVAGPARVQQAMHPVVEEGHAQVQRRRSDPHRRADVHGPGHDGDVLGPRAGRVDARALPRARGDARARLGRGDGAGRGERDRGARHGPLPHPIHGRSSPPLPPRTSGWAAERAAGWRAGRE